MKMPAIILSVIEMPRSMMGRLSHKAGEKESPVSRALSHQRDGALSGGLFGRASNIFQSLEMQLVKMKMSLWHARSASFIIARSPFPTVNSRSCNNNLLSIT